MLVGIKMTMLNFERKLFTKTAKKIIKYDYFHSFNNYYIYMVVVLR